MSEKLKIAEQEFYDSITPEYFARSFKDGGDSKIVLNGITVNSKMFTPPAGIKLSNKDKSNLMAFSYENAARSYADQVTKKV